MSECHACIQSTVVNPGAADDWCYSPLHCRGTLDFTFVVKYGFLSVGTVQVATLSESFFQVNFRLEECQSV